jgi:hypothetical protein
MNAECAKPTYTNAADLLIQHTYTAPWNTDDFSPSSDSKSKRQRSNLHEEIFQTTSMKIKETYAIDDESHDNINEMSQNLEPLAEAKLSMVTIR